MKSWKQREMLFGGAILTFIVPLKSDLILWTLHICLQFDINEIIFVITFTVVLEMLSVVLIISVNYAHITNCSNTRT